MSVALALTAAAPLLWAALGETLGERAGVLNIGIEGVMLSGCLAAALAAPETGPWVAVGAAAAAGIVLNGAFAAAVLLGAEQVVAGTGMVLVGVGLTGTVYRHLQAVGRAGGLVPTLPWGPAELVPIALAVALGAWLARSRWGLVVRAAGENPEALAAAGADPRRVRLATLLVAGALSGIGGAVLVLRGAGSFVEGMTAGRGFLALALVMLGRWRPIPVTAGALVLGAALALQFHLQGLGFAGLPYPLLLVLPYAMTLGLLAALPPARLGGPAALGRPYVPQR